MAFSPPCARRMRVRCRQRAKQCCPSLSNLKKIQGKWLHCLVLSRSVFYGCASALFLSHILAL